MAITVDVRQDIRNIILSGALDIEQAAELKGVLMDAIASSLRVCIHVAAVSAMDVTIVQLLWASASQAKSAGTGLIVEGPLSEAVEISLPATGLFPLMETLMVRCEEGVGHGLSIRN
jgi:anti-anti-sigma factor